MQYLGIDVHSSASVWCLLDAHGHRIDQGRVATNHEALVALGTQLRQRGPLLVGHEVGTQAYLVHDAFTAANIPIEAFNAAHLRMIASSRKKTDKRDAYWIARALQTGMKPNPVFIPSGLARALRSLLADRDAVLRDFKRWQYRARARLRARGTRLPPGRLRIQAEVERLLESPDGIDSHLFRSLDTSDHLMSLLAEELANYDRLIAEHIHANPSIDQLLTIPGFGKIVAAQFYATVADVTRFPNSRALTSYVGLVPSIRQTGDVAHLGNISKEGSPALRRVMVQAAHVIVRSRSPAAMPLRAIYERIYANKKRQKIAIVALARHLVQIGYRVWRDGTNYDPSRVRCTAH